MKSETEQCNYLIWSSSNIDMGFNIEGFIYFHKVTQNNQKLPAIPIISGPNKTPIREVLLKTNPIQFIDFFIQLIYFPKILNNGQ
jgi:hypothetical protein